MQSITQHDFSLILTASAALDRCLEAAESYLKQPVAATDRNDNSPTQTGWADTSACTDHAAMQCLHTAVDFCEALRSLPLQLQRHWLAGADAPALPEAAAAATSTPAAPSADSNSSTSSAATASNNTQNAPPRDLGAGVSTALVRLQACCAAAGSPPAARALLSACTHVAAGATPLAEAPGSSMLQLQGALTDAAWAAMGRMVNAAGTRGGQTRLVGLLNALMSPGNMPPPAAKRAFLVGITSEGAAARALCDPSAGEGDWFWGVELSARCCSPGGVEGGGILREFVVERGGLALMLQGLKQLLMHPSLPLAACIAVVHAGVILSHACKDSRSRIALLELSPALVKSACCVFVDGLKLAHSEQHLEGMQYAASALCNLILVESDSVVEGYIESGALDTVASVALHSMTTEYGTPQRMDEGPGGVLALVLANLAGSASVAIQNRLASPVPVKVFHLMLEGHAGDGAAVQAGKALGVLHRGSGTRARLQILQAVFEAEAPWDAPSRVLAWISRNSDSQFWFETAPWDLSCRLFSVSGLEPSLERLGLAVALVFAAMVASPFLLVFCVQRLMGA